MIEFRLPEIGEGVVEGEIVTWLKELGDAVEANEALVEVMTDKATIEVPAPAAGRLVAIKAEVGSICAIDAVIAVLDPSGAEAPARSAPAQSAQSAQNAHQAKAPARNAQEPAAAPPAPVAPAAHFAQAQPQPQPQPQPNDAGAGPLLATPAARALARESGIDLAEIAVDGRGRRTKADVLRHRESSGAAAAQGPGTPRPAAAAGRPLHAGEPAEGDTILPFRGMRRRIADSMTRSYTAAVHYTYVEQIDVTRLVKLRKEAKAAAAEQGVALSYLPFIVKAVVHALRRYPIVNAELDEVGGRVLLRQRVSVGIATATEHGLVVPVIHDADRRSILDLAREIARLSAAAREGKASRDELTGSTFTITSLGTIGGVLATPILNFPEVGILGVHAIRKAPIVTADDRIVVGHLMNLSVSLDHRVVDGFEGASFLQEVRRYLEDPNLLLLAGI